jgi:hypothetical protein
MGDCAATLGATGYTTQQTLSEVWHNKFRSFLSFDNGLIAVLSETHATSALKLLVQAIKREIDHIALVFGLNSRNRFKNGSGLGRIRTGDLRHVKTDDFRISAPFSDTELDGDMTTRKAKAPL